LAGCPIRAAGRSGAFLFISSPFLPRGQPACGRPCPRFPRDNVSSLLAMKRVRPEAVSKVLAVLVFTLPLLFHSPSLKITSAFYSSVVIFDVMHHAVLPTPSVSSRSTYLHSCRRSAYENPQFPVFVFKSLRTLSFSVSSKSFPCHSYENCRVCTNNSHSGACGSPVIARKQVKFFLFKFLRTILHGSKCQRLCFQALPHSLRKTPGVAGGGTPHPEGDAGPEKRNTEGPLKFCLAGFVFPVSPAPCYISSLLAAYPPGGLVHA